LQGFRPSSSDCVCAYKVTYSSDKGLESTTVPKGTGLAPYSPE